MYIDINISDNILNPSSWKSYSIKLQNNIAIFAVMKTSNFSVIKSLLHFCYGVCLWWTQTCVGFWCPIVLLPVWPHYSLVRPVCVCVSTGQLSLEAEKTWLQYECERWGLNFNLEGNPGISPSFVIGRLFDVGMVITCLPAFLIYVTLPICCCFLYFPFKITFLQISNKIF